MSDITKNTSTIPTYLNVGKILSYAMYALTIIAEIVLGLRVFLLATSANPDTPFVKFIYNTSSDFLNPFRGIFPPHSVGQTGYLDVSSLFAMIIYGFIAWGFAALIHYINYKISTFTNDDATPIATVNRQPRQPKLS